MRPYPSGIDVAEDDPRLSVQNLPNPGVGELPSGHVNSFAVRTDRHAVDPKWIVFLPQYDIFAQIVSQHPPAQRPIGAIAQVQHTRSRTRRRTTNSKRRGY